ncbi:MarC family protein [Salipiger sp. P9]|uniref:MarC family protein n=1 Tax=Salipiger pentaromativorans TaxID=2943193 RepID=UPI0021578176|nr:MarC family protein [Salipiger pentaromativorans]MCR8550701.1 MarC family protein [Salipiger pentaromativorans]
MDTAFLIKFLGAIFAIMNPFVNLPVFLSLTDGMDLAQQRRAALMTVVYSAILCAVVAFGGPAILGFFGISVDDFRVAGGLVLMIIGLGMLNGSAGSAHHGTRAEKAGQDPESDPSFYPLSFPMLVGPGTITTIVVFTGQARAWPEYLAIAAGLAGVLIALGLVMFFAAKIGHYLSHTLRVVMIRLMGMILAAIAVEMIASGLKQLLPGLA